MNRWKLFIVAVLLAVILPVGLSLGGCGHDHRHHHQTNIPAIR